MISIAEADLFHQLCHVHTVTYRSVHHNLFREFSEKTNRFVRSLDDTRDEEALSEIVRVLRRYRFDLAAAPLAFNDPIVAPRIDVNALNLLVAAAAIAHPRLNRPARELAELMHRLIDSPDNPMLAAAEAILRNAQYERAAIVVAENRLARATHSALLSLPDCESVEVIAPDALRRTRGYDLLLLFGAARWFPDHVFNAPRANNIEVISYAWLRGHWHPTSSFLAPTVGRIAPPRALEDDDTDDLADVRLEIDWARIEFAADGEDDAANEVQDLVRARLYALQGGYGVLLEATDRRTTLVIDLDADDRVMQISDNDVEPGMFVVLRNDESGDYIAPVADKILGERASAYRADQTLWKTALRERVRRDGLQVTSRRLIADGSERGDETNLRNWISERNIAPRDQSDFAAITQVIELSNATNRLWRSARLIRNAHLRAGVVIRQRLVEKVKNVDVAELETLGRADFELPEVEGGRLTAFRIEARASLTTFQPSVRIERVFKARD